MTDTEEEVAAAEPTFFYSTSGPPLGPCTVAQFRVLWISGHISESTSLWREGMSAWKPILEVAEVSSVLSSLRQPPKPPSDLWHYLDSDSHQRGGVTAEQMGMLVRRGEVDGLTSVWRTGMASWVELSSVAELRERLVVSDDEDADDDYDARAAMERAQQMTYDPDAAEFEVVRTRGPAAGGTTTATTKTTTSTAAACESGSSAGVGAGGPSAEAAAGAKPKRVRSKNKKNKFVATSGCNIYVSGLPDDANEEELAECFKVAGLLKTDPASGLPRVRLYRGPGGFVKGDALISFLKAESVALACTLRDGFEFRNGRRINVQPAKFEKREGDEGAARKQGGKLSKDEAQARKKQRLLEQRALNQWDAGLAVGKRSTTVILTGLFDGEAALAADDAFYANLRQDVEVECAKAGGVEKVTVFEGSEKGAAAVRFKEADDAERCVAMMDERQFGDAMLHCELYDGVTDYRAAAKQQADAAANGGGPIVGVGSAEGESMEDQEKKLDEFGDWLEAGSTDEELAADDEG